MQVVYLTKDYTVGYTVARSFVIPHGATKDGFRAFEGGGFFNVHDGLCGWASAATAGRNSYT